MNKKYWPKGERGALVEQILHSVLWIVLLQCCSLLLSLVVCPCVLAVEPCEQSTSGWLSHLYIFSCKSTLVSVSRQSCLILHFQEHLYLCFLQRASDVLELWPQTFLADTVATISFWPPLHLVFASFWPKQSPHSTGAVQSWRNLQWPAWVHSYFCWSTISPLPGSNLLRRFCALILWSSGRNGNSLGSPDLGSSLRGKHVQFKHFLQNQNLISPAQLQQILEKIHLR